MIKNIISYLIPFGGLMVLFFTFHFLDKNVANATPEVEPEKNMID